MKTGVSLPKIDDWETVIEWLEDVEDAQIAHESIVALKAARHDRAQPGWLAWDDVQNQLD